MPKREARVDYRGWNVEDLLAEWEELNSEDRKHDTNLKREMFRCAMALAEAYEKLDMGRKVVKFCDAALECVPNWVPAHLYKAQALVKMAESKLREVGDGMLPAKEAKKARRAVDAGLQACDDIPVLEGLSEYRRQLHAMQAKLPVATATSSTAPKKQKGGRSDGKGEAAAHSDGATLPEPPTADTRTAPRETPPTSSKVESALGGSVNSAVEGKYGEGGGVKVLRKKSAWNSKDTWEEVDLTDWAVDTLGELLEGLVFRVPDDFIRHEAPRLKSSEATSSPAASKYFNTVKLTALREAKGHAQVVYFQGKTRFLFELSFELEWIADMTYFEEAEEDGGAEDPGQRETRKRFKGRLAVGEVQQDLSDADEVSVQLPPFSMSKQSSNNPAYAAARRWLERGSISGGEKSKGGNSQVEENEFGSFRDAIFAKLKVFEVAFRGLGDDGAESGETMITGTSGSKSKRRADEAKGREAKEAAQRELQQHEALRELRAKNPNLQLNM